MLSRPQASVIDHCVSKVFFRVSAINAMKSFFLSWQPSLSIICSRLLNVLTTFPPVWGMLVKFICAKILFKPIIRC